MHACCRRSYPYWLYIALFPCIYTKIEIRETKHEVYVVGLSTTYRIDQEQKAQAKNPKEYVEPVNDAHRKHQILPVVLWRNEAIRWSHVLTVGPHCNSTQQQSWGRCKVHEGDIVFRILLYTHRDIHIYTRSMPPHIAVGIADDLK